MKNFFYRIRQLVFSFLLIVIPQSKQKVLSGSKSLLKLPELLEKDCVSRFLFVTTPGFIKRGSLNGLFKSLEEKGIKYFVFSGVVPDPSIECIEEGLKVFIENQCQAIVAVGGGSVLDCSKVIGARAACPKKSVQQMAGLFKINKKLCKFYAVPTTAGTGSEVTAGAVITDTVINKKFTVLDLCIVPSCVILDPDLTITLPPAVTAATGIDAMTHAVEAYVNCFRSKKARTSALKAVSLISGSLLKAYENGNDLQARENLLTGSCYAGIAIENAFVGYVHAVAHAAGGLYHVTHGQANAVILPAVLELYGKKVHAKLSELADAAGLAGESKRDKAQKFIEFLRELNSKTGLPEKLKLNEEDFPEITGRAINEANPMYPVPVIWNEKKLEELLWKIKE